MPASGGPPVTIASGLNCFTGVAVDAAGNIFIADAGNFQVVEVQAGGGAQFTLLGGLSGVNQVALDAAGDLYIANENGNQVIELNRSQALTFNFASTTVGQTSTDSPMSTQIQNIGNQPLNAVPPGLSVRANFTQVNGQASFTDCTASFSLTAGQFCILSVNFTLLSVGAVSSAAVFTGNSLNATPLATQSIALAGTGTHAATTTSLTGTSNAVTSTSR